LEFHAGNVSNKEFYYFTVQTAYNWSQILLHLISVLYLIDQKLAFQKVNKLSIVVFAC